MAKSNLLFAKFATLTECGTFWVFAIYFANEKKWRWCKLQQRSWLIPLFSGDSPKNWCGSVTVRHRNSPQIAPAWQPTYIPQAYIALCTLLLRVIYSRDIGEIAANTHVVDGGTLPWVKRKHLQKYSFSYISKANILTIIKGKGLKIPSLLMKTFIIHYDIP